MGKIKLKRKTCAKKSFGNKMLPKPLTKKTFAILLKKTQHAAMIFAQLTKQTGLRSLENYQFISIKIAVLSINYQKLTKICQFY